MELTELVCSINKLTSLDVSKNIKLGQLRCDDNQLTNLDLSVNTKLKALICCNNQLTSVDISNKTTVLNYLNCSNNQLSAVALNALFEMLHSVTWGDLYITDNYGINDCNQSIAISKGWIINTY